MRHYEIAARQPVIKIRLKRTQLSGFALVARNKRILCFLYTPSIAEYFLFSNIYINCQEKKEKKRNFIALYP